MASIADFPVDAMTWGDPSDKGVFSLMQAKHSKGYIALHLPPATLAFDVEDPKSHYAPRMKLRVSGDVVAWLRELDARAVVSLAQHLKDHPYKPCVQEGSYGCQLEVKPMNGTAVWIYDAEGRKTRGSLADLKRGVTVPEFRVPNRSQEHGSVSLWPTALRVPSPRFATYKYTTYISYIGPPVGLATATR